LFVSTLRSTVPGLLSPATTARDRAEQQDEHNQYGNRWRCLFTHGTSPFCSVSYGAKTNRA
jgi:hypothetical protein